LLTLTASPARASGQSAERPDQLTADLRRIAFELGESVRQFQADLDREMALHDRGYRTGDGRRIRGADTGFMGGPADVTLSTVQKLIAARMIAARRTGYEPSPVADSDRIQSLIEKARDDIARANDSMRQFFVVSAKDLNSRADLQARTRRNELAKARTAASEAARKALAVLPVDLPSEEPSQDRLDKTLNIAVGSLPAGKNDGARAGGPPHPSAGATPEDFVLPIRLSPGQKVTLVREPFRRVALTDSGIEDGSGRRLFYQEEWAQHQGATTLKRWAVVVDTATGQHALLRQYDTREFAGELDDAYRWYGNLASARMEIPDTPPAQRDIAPALADTDRARSELDRTLKSYQALIREASEQARIESSLDSDLPTALRETLFAIRGHLARAGEILAAEGNVRRAGERTEGKVEVLEALVAWSDGFVPDGESSTDESRVAREALNRSDAVIAAARSLERDARAALPADVSQPEAQFPALMKDMIVRLRGASGEHPGTAHCRQELWRMDISKKGAREVRRSISLIDIDTVTGNQIRISEDVTRYPLGVGDTLESIYDENSARR
jgi:hypothetical protein